MTTNRLFSRAALVAISGASEDAVVFWIRQGLLRSSTEGERKHLRFDQSEVKIAACLSEARAIGLNVKAMADLIAEVRAGLDVFRLFDGLPKPLDIHDALQAQVHFAASTDREYLESCQGDKSAFDDALAALGEGGELEADRLAALRDFGSNWSERDGRLFWIGANFAHGEGYLALERGKGGVAFVTPRLPEDGRISASSVVVFNLSSILKLEWPE